MSFLNRWWFWLLSIFIVIILLWWGYSQNDCINNKPCIAQEIIEPSDPPNVIKEKIQNIVDKAQPNMVPFILAASLAVTVPSVYYITGSSGTVGQLLAVFIFAFIALWFTNAWIQTHFYQPTLNKIMDGVDLL